MDEAKLREQAALGAKYREHLSDFHEAIDAVAAQYAESWQTTFDTAERENLWRAVQVCRKMKEHFGSLVSGGTLATHQLSGLKRLGK
jgi:hypothetical protein